MIIVCDTFCFKHTYFWKHSGFRVLKFSHCYMYFLKFVVVGIQWWALSVWQPDGFQFWGIFLTYFVDCLISVFSFWTSYYVKCWTCSNYLLSCFPIFISALLSRESWRNFTFQHGKCLNFCCVVFRSIFILCSCFL